MTTERNDYAVLRNALDMAYAQAASGKGAKRHANSKPFERQPIHEVGRIVGIGFVAGQVMKKSGEAAQMEQRGEYELAMEEFLGAIVYAAAAYNLCREKHREHSASAIAPQVDTKAISEELAKVK